MCWGKNCWTCCMMPGACDRVENLAVPLGLLLPACRGAGPGTAGATAVGAAEGQGQDPASSICQGAGCMYAAQHPWLLYFPVPSQTVPVQFWAFVTSVSLVPLVTSQVRSRNACFHLTSLPDVSCSLTDAALLESYTREIWSVMDTVAIDIAWAGCGRRCSRHFGG